MKVDCLIKRTLQGMECSQRQNQSTVILLPSLLNNDSLKWRWVVVDNYSWPVKSSGVSQTKIKMSGTDWNGLKQVYRTSDSGPLVTTFWVHLSLKSTKIISLWILYCQILFRIIGHGGLLYSKQFCSSVTKNRKPSCFVRRWIVQDIPTQRKQSDWTENTVHQQGIC